MRIILLNSETGFTRHCLSQISILVDFAYLNTKSPKFLSRQEFEMYICAATHPSRLVGLTFGLSLNNHGRQDLVNTE
jgi:hypothetical protein